jgi:hypothetical protein
MPETFLKIIDIFFIGFHTSLILFNVFGWLVPRWRFANFVSLSLTAFSWFILGIWFGWGYCICTDWHWQIRDMLGCSNMSASYVHFLILELTNIDMSAKLVDAYTAIVFVAVFLISIYLNLRKWIANKSR